MPDTPKDADSERIVLEPVKAAEFGQMILDLVAQNSDFVKANPDVDLRNYDVVNGYINVWAKLKTDLAKKDALIAELCARLDSRAIPAGERLPVDDVEYECDALRLCDSITDEIGEYVLCRARIQAKRRGSRLPDGKLWVAIQDVRDAASTLPLAPPPPTS